MRCVVCDLTLLVDSVGDYCSPECQQDDRPLTADEKAALLAKYDESRHAAAVHLAKSRLRDGDVLGALRVLESTCGVVR